MLHLAKNLKLIRMVAGDTQPSFGTRFNASRAMIVSYELGKAIPSDLFLTRVAQFAGVSENDLKNKELKESDIRVDIGENVFPVKTEGKAGPEKKDWQAEYLELLRLENDRKQKLLEMLQPNLIDVQTRSQAIHGHVVTLLQLEAERLAGKDPQKQAAMRDELSKRAVLNAGLKP